jgi:hypothetical protein
MARKLRVPYEGAIDHVTVRGNGQRTIWRPTLKYARTIHDADYAPDPGEFKLRMVCITSRVAS